MNAYINMMVIMIGVNYNLRKYDVKNLHKSMGVC